MATRNLQFFMLPSEFVALVERVAAQHHLWLILIGDRSRRVAVVAPGERLPEVDGGPLYRAVCLSADEPRLATADPRRVPLGKVGWISCDFPAVCNATLYKAQLGAKSDWFDLTSRTDRENPSVLQLFDAVAPHF